VKIHHDSSRLIFDGGGAILRRLSCPFFKGEWPIWAVRRVNLEYVKDKLAVLRTRAHAPLRDGSEGDALG
jgi:hypothetical protein